MALDDVERHALAGELDRVCVTELVWGKAPSHTGARRVAATLPVRLRRTRPFPEFARR